MRRVLAVIAIAATGLLPLPATAQTALTCFGRDVTILGTEGEDELIGTSGHDVISALGADDSAYGVSSGLPDVKDWICGGTESDFLNGGHGNDWLDGERGNDRLDGLDGQDRLFGGGGNDWITPHSGSDFADGGPGADDIENGFDRSLRWNSDTLHGGDGGDSVRSAIGGGGAWGSDALYGDAGNDEVDGRDSFEEASSTPDLVDGGPGNDRCVVDPDDTVVNCEDVTVVG